MSLASYDEMRGAWIVEPGDYTVYFSNSSAAEGIKQTLTLNVAEEITAFVAHKEAMAPNTMTTASGGRDGSTSAIFYEYTPTGLNLDTKVYRTRAADGNVALDYVFTTINKSASGNVGDVGQLILAEYDANGKLLGYVKDQGSGANAFTNFSNQTLTETTNTASSRNFISYNFKLETDSLRPETMKVRAFLWRADSSCSGYWCFKSDCRLRTNLAEFADRITRLCLFRRLKP